MTDLISSLRFEGNEDLEPEESSKSLSIYRSSDGLVGAANYDCEPEIRLACPECFSTRFKTPVRRLHVLFIYIRSKDLAKKSSMPALDCLFCPSPVNPSFNLSKIISAVVEHLQKNRQGCRFSVRSILPERALILRFRTRTPQLCPFDRA